MLFEHGLMQRNVRYGGSRSAIRCLTNISAAEGKFVNVLCHRVAQTDRSTDSSSHICYLDHRQPVCDANRYHIFVSVYECLSYLTLFK